MSTLPTLLTLYLYLYFHQSGLNLAFKSEPMMYFSLQYFILIGISCRLWGANMPNLTNFQIHYSIWWWHLVTQRKVKCGCTITNLPLSHDIRKLFLNSNDFMTVSTKIYHSKVCDGHSKKTHQTFAPSAMCEVRAPPYLQCKVIEEIHTIFAHP